MGLFLSFMNPFGTLDSARQLFLSLFEMNGKKDFQLELPSIGDPFKEGGGSIKVDALDFFESVFDCITKLDPMNALSTMIDKFLIK